MTTSAVPLTKTGRELVDLYFIENRTRVLEIAAFLDRLDRAEDSPDADYRIAAFRDTLQVLSSGTFPRVEKIQMILSDPTMEPLAKADVKSARGAYDRTQRGG